MKRRDKLLFGILLFFMVSASAEAQLLDNLQARPALSADYQFNEKWTADATYYQYLDNNISAFDKSVWGIKVNYNLNAWLQIAANYRLGLKKEVTSHDFRYSLNLKPNFALEKWQFSYQPLFQQKIEPGNNPENYLRNQLKAQYNLTPKIALFALTENYLKINHGLNHNTQKYAFGTELALSKRSDLEFQFTVKDKPRENRYARLELNYIYHIGK